MAMSNGVTGGVFANLADLQASRPRVNTRLQLIERGNAEYIVQPVGYTPQAGDLTCNNGTVAALQVEGVYRGEWFGLKMDGTDETDTFELIISAVPDSGGVVTLPPGELGISRKITIGNGTISSPSSKQNIIFKGSGGGSVGAKSPDFQATTRIKWIGSAHNDYMIEFAGPMTCGWHGISLDGNFAADKGFFINHVYQSNFSDFVIEHCRTLGLDLQAYYSATGVFAACSNNIWDNVKVDTRGFPGSVSINIGVDNAPLGTGSFDVNRNTFQNCMWFHSDDVAAAGLVLRHCDVLTFINCFGTSPSRTSPPVKIVPPTGNLSFPAEIVFYNSAMLGEFDIDPSWAPRKNRGMAFWPYNTADTELQTNPYPIYDGVRGVTTEFQFFDTFQLETVKNNSVNSLPACIFRDYTESTLTNSSTRTSLSTFSLPAGSMGTDRKIKVVASGRIINDTGVNRDARIVISYGTQEPFRSQLVNLPSSPNGRAFVLECEFNVKNNNPALQSSAGKLVIGEPGSNGSDSDPVGFDIIHTNDGLTVDTTEDQNISFDGEFGFASSSLTMVLSSFDVHII